MSDVQFESDRQIAEYRSRTILGQATTPRMVIWLIKHGVVKTEKAAGRFLLTVMFVCLAIMVYFLLFANGAPFPV